MSSRVHSMPIQVLFRHCDPAAIVFYPRYVELVHDVVEHWFNHGLLISYYTLHSERSLGIPTVNLQVDFKAPSRLGDQLSGHLRVLKLGRTSAQLNVQLCGPDNKVRVEATATIVFVSVKDISPLEIPADFRERMSLYLVDDQA
ncbi:acyl-CoA thioesterase [Pusillimonas sp. CC-YST705]|uniref:Acyl-CoA thioesterase n=1 Tax=Mesopusillimonas faecipullorum TaxID=2755040 RepID=A0ABS8CCQ4_9BURK|nr:acyl-CoA thioesterase [Mesopusillimonas faecipullorum]MCB5363807.1 acyl-CoA thioesterase [Mesopusillimonas faecipullorum]